MNYKERKLENINEIKGKIRKNEIGAVEEEWKLFKDTSKIRTRIVWENINRKWYKEMPRCNYRIAKAVKGNNEAWRKWFKIEEKKMRKDGKEC